MLVRSYATGRAAAVRADGCGCHPLSVAPSFRQSRSYASAMTQISDDLMPHLTARPLGYATAADVTTLPRRGGPWPSALLPRDPTRVRLRSQQPGRLWRRLVLRERR